MIKDKWLKLKMCFTIILLLFSLLWIFALYLRYIQSDFRVDMLGLQKVSSSLSDGKYIRQIDTPFQAENFQLIEIMNQTNPNTITNDAVLVISASNQLTYGQYVSLIQYIDKSNRKNPLLFYIVRRKKNILFHTTKQIRGEVYDIVQMLQYFSQLLLVKKLTVISFEEGSLLTLRSLAHVRYDVFQIIDTFILINPFNPTMPVFISTPYSFIQNTKQLIVRDKLRVQLMNSTKMLIINTIDDNMGYNKRINWIFQSSSNDKVSFANTAIVSSKYMWNVYSYLKVEEYFKFQPFLWIITKCFNQNRQNKELKIKDLQYILLYKQLVQTKTMSMIQKKKILNKCIDFYIQNYGYDGVIFKTQCVRVLRKQNVYYNQNTTFLISGNNKFQVYGQFYQKLPAFDTKSQQLIYILQNVNQYKRFFIINRKKINIRLTIQSSILPKSMLYKTLQIQEFLHDLQFKNYFLKNNTRKEVIKMCPGSTLVFPNHFGPRNSWDKKLYLQSFQTPSSFCYKANDFLMFWLQQIVDYWSLGYNIIIFSFYCTHILQTSTFSRFYWQFFINTLLAFFAMGAFLPLENILLLTIVVLIQILFKLWRLTADLINAPKYLVSRMLWVPVLLQIIQQIQPDTYPNPWKVLGIQFYALVNEKNIVILFLQVGFAWTFLDIDDINFSSVGLICAWLFVTTPEQEQEKKLQQQNRNHNLLVIKTGKRIKSVKQIILKFRNQVVDTITICIIALCVSQDGLILHYVTDFYVITYVLFAIHKASNDYLS